MNKMLGDVVQQRLAFLLPYEDAKQYAPNLHLCKAHWTRKKRKPSGRPLGDLTYVDGTPVNTRAMSEAAAEHHCENRGFVSIHFRFRKPRNVHLQTTYVLCFRIEPECPAINGSWR